MLAGETITGLRRCATVLVTVQGVPFLDPRFAGGRPPEKEAIPGEGRGGRGGEK